MTPGINFVVIEYEGEDSEYFNSAENVSQSFFHVDARFEFNIEEIVENEQESVRGSVRIIANDTDLGLPGLSVSVFLFQENGTHYSMMSPSIPMVMVWLNLSLMLTPIWRLCNLRAFEPRICSE